MQYVLSHAGVCADNSDIAFFWCKIGLLAEIFHSLYKNAYLSWVQQDHNVEIPSDVDTYMLRMDVLHSHHTKILLEASCKPHKLQIVDRIFAPLLAYKYNSKSLLLKRLVSSLAIKSKASKRFAGCTATACTCKKI